MWDLQYNKKLGNLKHQNETNPKIATETFAFDIHKKSLCSTLINHFITYVEYKIALFALCLSNTG
jgi:hypothetical protein